MSTKYDVETRKTTLDEETLELIKVQNPELYQRLTGKPAVDRQPEGYGAPAVMALHAGEALRTQTVPEQETLNKDRQNALKGLLSVFIGNMRTGHEYTNNTMKNLVDSDGLVKILLEGAGMPIPGYSEQGAGGGIFAQLNPEDVKNTKGDLFELLNKNGINGWWAGYTGNINSGQYGPTIAFSMNKKSKNQWNADQRHVLMFSMISDQERNYKPALAQNHVIITDGTVSTGGQERQGVGSRQIERYTRYFDPSTGRDLDLYHGRTVYEHNGYIRRNYLTTDTRTIGRGGGLTEEERSEQQQQLWADNLDGIVLVPDAITVAINFNLPVRKES